MKFKTGDKVYNKFLGYGKIVKDFDGDLYMVLYEKTQPYRYNLRTNPTIEFGVNLKKYIKRRYKED
jgi:hypothetical protein